MGAEARLQYRIIKRLKEEHHFVIKTQGGALGTPIGTPDIVTIGANGRFVGLEIKRPDGKGVVSPEQKFTGRQIRDNQGCWFVIDSWERFMEVYDAYF